MPFPSVYNSFNRPAASDRLNNPSHSALHNTVSSALGQVEAVIGLSTSSAVGTLMYDVRSPDSNGGGHVQTANKGGTGQTSYTKGDLLVASSSSVLSKLAVSSTTGEVLIADTTRAVGVRWGATVANKIAVYNSVVAKGTGQASVNTILYAASIVGSTIGINNAIKFHGNLQKLAMDTSDTLSVHLNYGDNLVASVVIGNPTQSVVGGGLIDGAIYGNNSSVAQLGYLRVQSQTNKADISTNGGIAIVYGYAYGNSSIQTSADQTLTITASMASVGKSSILTGAFLIEKIA